MFHFNKKHLEDNTIPMWVIKLRGETFYVEHVNCSVPWSTKETPDNNHTKGSIKVKNCLVKIDEDNVAHISELTEDDKQRLSDKKEFVRIITSAGYKLKKLLETFEIQHGQLKTFGGGCSTTWFVTDLYSKDDFFQLKFALTGSDLRILMPNEDYYKLYDKYDEDDIDLDGLDWEDLYEE